MQQLDNHIKWFERRLCDPRLFGEAKHSEAQFAGFLQGKFRNLDPGYSGRFLHGVVNGN